MLILILSYLTETKKKEEITPLKLENSPICFILEHFRFFLCISIFRYRLFVHQNCNFLWAEAKDPIIHICLLDQYYVCRRYYRLLVFAQ